MKKSLLLIFLSAIVLAGCTNGLSKSELFEKKQECAAYKNNLQKEIDKEIAEFKVVGDFFSKTIDEIFYSSKENSCFALVQSTRSTKR